MNNCNYSQSNPNGLPGLPPQALEVIYKEGPVLFHKATFPASLGDDTRVPPEKLPYRDIILEYEANGHVYIYSSDSIPTKISDGSVSITDLEKALEQLGVQVAELETNVTGLQDKINEEITARQTADANLSTEITEKVSTEATAREAADNNLQSQVDAIVASTDVKDVVGTKAELEAYDTSTLGNNDIIKVLNDESENGAITYYRWSTADNKFTLIGETGPYYTKAEANEEFATKAEVGAIDTTKLNELADIKTIGENLELTEDGTLNSTGGVELYNTFSTAEDGANTAAFINSKLNTNKVIIGSGAIGTPTANWSCVAIGNIASATGVSSISIGDGTRNNYERSIALGSQSRCGRNHELSIGSGSAGSGVPISRYLANVKAGENDTDAVNLKQMQDYVAENAGGSSVTLYSSYSTATDGANTAKFINDKFNSKDVVLGVNAALSSINPYQGAIAIGWGASASSESSVVIGPNASAQVNDCVTLGVNASTQGASSTAIGGDASCNNSSSYATALGAESMAQHDRSVALGALSRTGRTNEVSIGQGAGVGNTIPSRFLANVKAGVNPTDAVNLTQLREATMGTVLYGATDHEAVITLSQNVSQFERVRAIGSWVLPYQTGGLELQVFGEYQLNDQDQAKTFQLHAQDFDPETGEKTEITDTWTFTNPTTLSLVSSITVSGPLTDPVITTNDVPAINLSKIIGYPVV